MTDDISKANSTTTGEDTATGSQLFAKKSVPSKKKDVLKEVGLAVPQETSLKIPKLSERKRHREHMDDSEVSEIESSNTSEDNNTSSEDEDQPPKKKGKKNSCTPVQRLDR